MGNALLKGIIEPCHQAGRDAARFDGTELPAHLGKVTQVVSLNKVQDHVMRLADRGDFVNGHDVGVLELHAQFGLAVEEIGFARDLRLAFPQHLDRKQFVGDAVRRPIDAGKRARSDHVQHLVVTVEETSPKVL